MTWFTKEFRKNLPWSLAWLMQGKGSFWFSYAYQRCLALGWVWPFMFTAGAAFFTVFSGLNPLQWRSFSNTDPLMISMHAINGTWAGYSNHHFLNLVAEAALCFGLAAWFAKSTIGPSFTKKFYSFGLLASFGAIWVWSIHEGMWWVVYIIAAPLFYGQHLVPIWFSGFGEIFTLGLLMLTAALGLFFPWKYAGLMAAFYVAWFAVGFPITESYLGNTQWYNTVWGDSWEVGSWLFGAWTFYHFEKEKLLKWYEEIKLIAAKGQVYYTH